MKYYSMQGKALQGMEINCVLVFVELKSVVTDSEVLILSNKIKKFMEVKTDTIRRFVFTYFQKLIRF